MVSETLINCIITKSTASLWFLSLYACMLQARSKVVIKTQVDNNINVLSSGSVIYLYEWQRADFCILGPDPRAKTRDPDLARLLIDFFFWA